MDKSNAEIPLFVRALCDPLLTLAKVVHLVPDESYDQAWDAIEELKRGFYQPAADVEAYLREGWMNLVPTGAVIQRAAMFPGLPDEIPEVQHFLSLLAKGRPVQVACTKAGLCRSTVYHRRANNLAFAAAVKEAQRIGKLVHGKAALL